MSTSLDAPPFQLSLLGHFNLVGPRGPIDLGNKKLCALLAFVICAASSEPPSRESLATLLWESHFAVEARHSLRQALTRLRRALDDDVFVSNDTILAIRPGLFRCDAISFESLIHASSRNTRKAAVDFYQGTFLANIAIPEKAWTNWITAQRQRLEDLAVDGLIRLGEEEEAQGTSAHALAFAYRAVAINDLREDGHRLILRSLMAAGQQAEALQHYDHLAARLKHDLNVEPDAATTALVTAPAPRASDVPFPSAAARIPLLSDTLPSIAVLPLQNLSGDPGDDYFADGIVEDIVVSLANLRELLVISRSSTLAFRGRQVDPRTISRVLGVRYVLEGSMRRSATMVRVSIQLCDTETGASLWGERLEVPMGDLFEVQDHVVHHIVAGIAPNVRAAELERALRIRPTNLTAYDHTLRALSLINSLDRQTFHHARNHLDMAMAAHPRFAMPAAWAARWHSIWVGQGWSDNPRVDAARAVALATRALDLDRHNALALATYAHLLSFLFHDYDSALVYFDRALSAGPSSSLAWILSSATLGYVGRGDDAVRHAEHALRLSPRDRSLFVYYNFLSMAHYGNGNYEEAVKWGRLSAAENPTFTSNLRMLATSLAALDQRDEARHVASTLLKLEPDFRLSVYERTRQPFRQPEIKVRFMEHLKRTGLPP